MNVLKKSHALLVWLPKDAGNENGAVNDVGTVAAREGIAQLAAFLGTNHDIVRLATALSPGLAAFDVAEVSDPRALLCRVVQLVGPEGSEVDVFEGAPTPLIDEVLKTRRLAIPTFCFFPPFQSASL
jgi:hypothetical protein